jgi:microcompartment protein CcmL/EutN
MSESNGSLRNDQNPVLFDVQQAEPCLALLELCSVARGVEVADGLLKEAPVEVHFATPVQPGKYLVLFSGPVEAVAAAGRRGGELAGGDLVDRLHLPQAHPQLLAGLRRRGGVIQGRLDAIAVLETSTVASALAAADLALKTANVDLLDLRVANGLGGKSFFTLTGEVSDVRAALTAAARQAEAGGHLLRQVVIAQPHPELVRHL